MTISIIVACFVLFLISLILVISIYIFRRQHWKKNSRRTHRSLPLHQTLFKDELPLTSPSKSDYDNVIYDAFKKSSLSPSTTDGEQNRSPMSTSDDYSYEPKIVYLGGDEQLTAIFA